MQPGARKQWSPVVLKPTVFIGCAISFVVFKIFTQKTTGSEAEEPQASLAQKDATFYGLTVSERAEMHVKEVPKLVLLDHIQRQQSNIMERTIRCIRTSCNTQMTMCRDDKDCQTTLRHFTRQCHLDDPNGTSVCEDLVRAGLLSECPKAFNPFKICFDKECGWHLDDRLPNQSPYLFQDEASQYRVSSAEMQKLAELIENVEDQTAKRVNYITGMKLGVHRIETTIPGLMGRLREASELADKQQGWGLWTALRDAGNVIPNLHCITIKEFDGDDQRLQDAYRADHSGFLFGYNSLVTAAFVLPSKDSATSCQLAVTVNNPCGPKILHSPLPGQVLVFESFREHHVLPAAQTRCKVVYFEFWEFQENGNQDVCDIHPEGLDISLDDLETVKAQAFKLARRHFYKQLIRSDLTDL